MIWDAIRIFSVGLIGAALMFLVQPWFYQSGIIPLTDVDVEVWLAENYVPGAAIVFATSLAATIMWYVIASRTSIDSFADASPMRLVWGGLLLLPILGICTALYFFNDSSEALLFLTGLYVVNVLLVFWFSTAISSPGLLKFIPPGSFSVRHLLGLK